MDQMWTVLARAIWASAVDISAPSYTYTSIRHVAVWIRSMLEDTTHGVVVESTELTIRARGLREEFGYSMHSFFEWCRRYCQEKADDKGGEDLDIHFDHGDNEKG